MKDISKETQLGRNGVVFAIAVHPIYFNPIKPHPPDIDRRFATGTNQFIPDWITAHDYCFTAFRGNFTW